MHQNQISNSEALWDKCLRALAGVWAKQRLSISASSLHQANLAEYEVLLEQSCCGVSVRQAWHMNWFISSYRFGAGGVLERSLAGGGGEDVISLVDRRICLGNVILEDSGFLLGRYPEGLLQWLLMVSLGRVHDSLAWGRFLFEDRMGSAVDSDFTGLPLDEYCRLLWYSLNGLDHDFQLNEYSPYFGILRAWGKSGDLTNEFWRVMDLHLKDVTRLSSAEVFYLSPFNLCPVEVMAALQILGDDVLQRGVAGHPLYRNPVVSAVAASKCDTEDGLRLREWFESRSTD